MANSTSLKRLTFKLTKILIIVASLSSFIGLHASQYNHLKKMVSGRYELHNQVHKKLIKFSQSNNLIWNANNYVSIAQLNKNFYVIANYVHLFLLDNRLDRVCILKPIGLSNYKNVSSLSYQSKVLKSKVLKSKVYIPTGVFIDHKKNLYVANYKSNNILEGSINTKKCEVHFTREFSSTNTKGPENVSVDDKNNILVSANYDAGTVTAFNLTDGKERWATNIGQAHGVAISDNKVYATGLTERKIYELRLDDGKIINTIGSIGWDPMKSQFLWPTSIYPYNDNELVLSDAQSGFVSFLDKKTLKTIKYTGGNGPSYHWFNYPYSAYPTKNQLVILSSQRGEILFLDSSGTTVKKNLISFKDNWPKFNYLDHYIGPGWDSYINVDGPKLTIRNRQYKLGFGHLHPIEPGPTLRVPDISTLYNLGPYIYFLQGANYKDINYVFSSSSTTLLGIINQAENPDVLISSKIRLDSWLYHNNLINVDGIILPESKLTTEISTHGEQFYSLLHTKSWISPKNLYQLNDFSVQTRKFGYKEFIKYLDNVFISPIGREWKFVYDQCNETSCNIKKLKKAANNYYYEAQGYNYLNLDEFILVGMLSGVAPKDQDEKNQVDYDNCGIGMYYDGHGVDALKNQTPSSYLSALDIKSSYLCFSTKNKYTLDSIKFGWLSKEEVPSMLAIYGIQTVDDKEQKKLIKKFNINEVTNDNGYLSTTLNFNKQHKYHRFEIQLLKGGNQNRLLLRSLKPSFIKKQSDKRISLDDCGLGKYYEGYGIRALETKTLDDYLSANDLASSYVCFSNNKQDKRLLLKAIRFFWYSDLEAPKKIAVYGIKNSDKQKSKILIGEYPIDSYDELNGYIFSTIEINSLQGFDRYMVKLLEGGAQNRLLMRSIEPLFQVTSKNITTPYLLKLADDVSKKMHYGLGVNAQNITLTTNCNPKEVLKNILSAKTAHCGNYAYIFVSLLTDSYNWSIYDIRASDGRIHTIVEVTKNKITQIIDPTLGVIYPCNITSLINGTCDYSESQYLTKPNPALGQYLGVGFFYGAQITKKYSKIEDLTRLYCALRTTKRQ